MKHVQRISLRALLAPAIALLLIGAAQAQSITAYRYWFNDDIAALVEVPVTATPVMNTQIVLNSTGLAVGLHTVTVQFKDNDLHWSAPYTSVFNQKGGTITALQYWFNDDASGATQLSVTPAAEVDLTASLNASTLPVGLHRVTMRGLDDRGEWTVPYSNVMTRGGGQITGYEYWIDEQVDDRVMNAIGPADVVDLISALPLTTTDGAHTFTIRFHDEAEGWSVPITTAFTYGVGIEEIPGVSSYLLFPNPVQDQLTLRLDASVASALQVSLLDAAGRMVEAPTNWNVQGLTHRSWDTAALSPGIYTLRITSAEHALNLPFVKQ
jgi:hypothetical protein